MDNPISDQIDSVCEDLISRVNDGCCIMCGVRTARPSDIECDSCFHKWLDVLDAEIAALKEARRRKNSSKVTNVA